MVLLFIWNRSNSLNIGMIYAHSLPWPGAFLSCIKIWMSSSSGRHLIWPDIRSLVIWLSLTYLYHREQQLHEVPITWWASVHVMWHIQASSYLAEVDVMLLAEEVIIWQDRASECVFDHLHKLSVMHPVLTEAEILSMTFTWWRTRRLSWITSHLTLQNRLYTW